ncbi:MAG TPA: hypothetical protein D7H76_05100 [Candidatus Poseidoniales archaeon]|nr:MAG TPA: hypothetical protein D7H76_05100 [Candidatus Poseidoniales archaeon]
MFLLGRDAPSAYSESGTLGLQEYLQLAILALVFMWLLIDWRRRSKSGPVAKSEPPFRSGKGTKKDPYVLEATPMVTAGGSALSTEIITLEGINTNDIKTVSGPQFDITVVEQITGEDLSQDDHKIVFRLKLEDRDPDDLDEGVYEFMLTFKVARAVHFLWLATIDYRRGMIVESTEPKQSRKSAETESSVKVDAAISAAALAAERQRAEDEARKIASEQAKIKEAEQAKAKAAAAAALAATAAATKRQQAEDEARRASEAEAAKRIKAMEAELEARRLALEEMDAKQRKKEEELLRVAERAKEIDFTTLGVAARAAVSEPVEKGATELSVGDTSAFEESGSAWVQDRDGGMSISWTGKTASALIGVSGLKRAFAAAATVTARDDLQRIKGVGPFIAEKLNMLGITTFRQVANMTPELEDQVNTAIEFFPGRVRRDKWAAQAAKMADE